MNEKRCLDFLSQLFYQCVLNENFYHSCVKLGVNFLSWPSHALFETAKKFQRIVSTKSYNSALIELNIDVPDKAHKEILSEEEIKIFYSDYLNFLRALELTKKLKFNPEKAIELCNQFLENKITTAKKTNLSDAVGNFVENNEAKIKEGNSSVILKDFKCLSETVGGFNSGRVTIVTAYTGFGKTNFGVNFLKAAINDGLFCVYVNMEMDTTDMTKRFLQSFCKLRNYEFEKNDYIQKISVVQNLKESLSKNWITDGSTMSINEISQMVSEIKRTQKLDFVIVDYDQKIIMDDSGIKEEWQQVKKAVEMLEALSKKESVHVLMFAQTNEEKDGIPIASHRSMQPASSVIQFTRDGETSLMKFIKNRHGATNLKIELDYDPSLSLINEIGYKKESVLPPPQSQGFKRRQDIYG